MRAAAPSISTVSPRSSPVSCVRYVSMSAQRIGCWPMTYRPVNPVPRATAARPGASRSRVAIAAAVTIG